MLLSNGIYVAELHSDFGKNCQSLDHRTVLIFAKDLSIDVHELLDFGQSVVRFISVQICLKALQNLIQNHLLPLVIFSFPYRIALVIRR